MRPVFLIFLVVLSLESYSQQRSATKRSSRKTTIDNFTGTWILKSLADKHLEFRYDTVEKETLRFTNDSVFVSTEHKTYAGTWRLVGGQPVIKIKKTKRFNYNWIAGDVDEKFFTTKGLGYYKYFIRVNK